MIRTNLQRMASIRNLQKARSKLSEMMHEAAGAVIQSINDGEWVDLGDRGAVLDKVDSSLCGNALKSPVLKSWLYKLILNGVGIESLQAA